MADYEGRYDGNGEDVDASSPQPRSSNHGGLDDYSDSKSQVHIVTCTSTWIFLLLLLLASDYIISNTKFTSECRCNFLVLVF